MPKPIIETTQVAPSIPIVLLHNDGDMSLLNSTVGKEPLDPDGSRYTSQGINGKGELGNVSVVSANNAYGSLGNAGSTVKIEGATPIISAIEFPYEDDSTKKWQILYDERFPDKPAVVSLGSFTYDKKEDGKGKWKATSSEIHSNDQPVQLLKKTVKDNEILRTVGFIVKCLEERVAVTEGFAEECDRNNLDEIRSIGSALKLIELFDQYLSRTKENLSKVELLYKKIQEASLVENEPMATMEDIKLLGGLTEKYNAVSAVGISIGSLSSAKALISLINGSFDKSIKENPEDTQSVLLERQKSALNEMLLDMSDLASPLRDWREYPPSIQATSFKAVGRDSRGSIVVIQNNHTPLRSNGEVYQAIKETGEMDVIYQAEKLINSIYYENAEVSENLLRQADEAMRKLVESVTEHLYGSKSDSIKSVLKDVPSATTLLHANSEDSGKLFFKINSLIEYAKKAIVRKHLSENIIVKNNGLNREETRQRGTRLGARVDRDHLYKKDKDVYYLASRVPQLTFPVGSTELVRFKLLGTPVISIFADKETGQITELHTLANISEHRKLAKFGRVLNAISDLDPSADDIAENIRKLKGRGGKNYDGKLSNFGLSGIREEYPEIANRLGGMIHDIYRKLDEGDVQGAKQYIQELSLSKDENIRNVGMYVELVKREFDTNDILSSAWYPIRDSAMRKTIINDLNGGHDILALEGKPKSKYLAKLASVAISSCLTNFGIGEKKANERYGVISYTNQDTEVTRNLFEKVSKDLAYQSFITTGLVLMQKGKNGIRIANPIPEKISHTFLEYGEEGFKFDIKNLENCFVHDSKPLVDAEAIENAKAWYRENREVSRDKDREDALSTVKDAVEKELMDSGFRIDVSMLKIETQADESLESPNIVVSGKLNTDIPNTKVETISGSKLFDPTVEDDHEEVDNEAIIKEVIESKELEAFSPDDVALIGEHEDDFEHEVASEAIDKAKNQKSKKSQKRELTM